MVFLWFMGCTMGLIRLGRWLQREQCSSTALRQQQQHLLWGDACAVLVPRGALGDSTKVWGFGIA